PERVHLELAAVAARGRHLAELERAAEDRADLLGDGDGSELLLLRDDEPLARVGRDPVVVRERDLLRRADERALAAESALSEVDRDLAVRDDRARRGAHVDAR